MNITLKKPLATALKEPEPKQAPKPKIKKKISALNEVTLTIQMSDNVNFHDTVMIDLSIVNHFEFDGETYEIPIKETRHYTPSFLDFDKRLAQFFEFHTTTARFLDWFNFREKASVAVGYLYNKGQPSPVDLSAYALPLDAAALNYKILKNTSIEGHYTEIHNKLKPKGDLSGMKWLGLAIIAIVAAVVVITILTGGIGQTQQIAQNITATPAPLPTPIIIR